MADAPVIDRVREILCNLLLVAPEDVRPESRLVGELDVDSITFLDLAFTIEDRFGVQFPDLKADAELFSLPLPEALHRLEAGAGGANLFAFVKDRAVGRGGSLEHHTLGDLMRAVDGRVPPDLDPDAPVASVHLAHVFRSVTVATVARYVEHLIATRAAAP